MFSERLPMLTRSIEAVEHTFYTALTLAAAVSPLLDRTARW
jgi:hypothetical protein